MTPTIKIYQNSQALASALAEEFTKDVNAVRDKDIFTVALSGSNTPRMFFAKLASAYSTLINWQKVQIFWVDERCVAPDHPDSNYGMTRASLLQTVAIPEKNVHRIRGESDPFIEAHRYSQVIDKIVPKATDNWPVFDWMFLGVGEDGHTASLFPGSTALNETESLCAVAVHPQTRGRRITLTLPVINHAKRTIFMVSGESKAKIMAVILGKKSSSQALPATRVQPLNGVLEWYVDTAAASLLS